MLLHTRNGCKEWRNLSPPIPRGLDVIKIPTNNSRIHNRQYTNRAGPKKDTSFRLPMCIHARNQLEHLESAMTHTSHNLQSMCHAAWLAPKKRGRF